MKQKFLLAILVLGFISCSTHSVTETPTIELNDIVLNSSKLNMESAAEQAVQIRSLLSDGTGTRGASNISVLDVKPMTQAATRNGTSTTDTLVYIVNFEDDNGYVILSADQTTYPILSFSDSGNFDLDELNESETASFIYSSIFNTISQNSNNPFVDTIAGDNGDYGELILGYTNWTLDSEVEPLVPVEWFQWAPFNAKLDPINDTIPPIGCVATAAMQLMAMHQKPTGYDWDEIISTDFRDPSSYTSSAADAVSTLAREFGEKIGMTYTTTSGSASTLKVPEVLRTYGFNSDEAEDYSDNTLITELSNNRALYISGFNYTLNSSNILPLVSDDSDDYDHAGHAWVADGYMKFKRMCTILNTATGELSVASHQYKIYPHYNIGWKDQEYNAYYLLGTFDMYDHYDVPDEADDEPKVIGITSTSTDGRYNYQYYVKLIKNIY